MNIISWQLKLKTNFNSQFNKAEDASLQKIYNGKKF